MIPFTILAAGLTAAVLIDVRSRRIPNWLTALMAGAGLVMAVGGSSFVGGVGGPDEIEKVTVSYTWNVLTPILRPFFTNGQVQFRVSSMMKNEKYQ